MQKQSYQEWEKYNLNSITGAHTSTPAQRSALHVYMAPRYYRTHSHQLCCFWACSGTRSIQVLLGGDPASTLLSSILFHKPELTPSLLPTNRWRSAHDSHNPQVLPTCFHPWGKPANCWLVFPKVIILFISNVEHLPLYSISDFIKYWKSLWL